MHARFRLFAFIKSITVEIRRQRYAQTVAHIININTIINT